MISDNRFLIETKLSMARITSDEKRRELLLDEITKMIKNESADSFAIFIESIPNGLYKNTDLYEQYIEENEYVSRQYFYRKIRKYDSVSFTRTANQRSILIKR